MKHTVIGLEKKINILLFFRTSLQSYLCLTKALIFINKTLYFSYKIHIHIQMMYAVKITDF